MSDRDETTVGRESGAPGRRAWTGIAVALAVGAAAINGARMLRPAPQLRGTPVEFELRDTGGRVVSDRTLRGRPYAILFGFTRCPDVCPTTLARIAQARADLDAAPAGLQVMFVGIDTQHDSPGLLNQYLSQLAPATKGLTGTPDQIERAAQAFAVYYRRVPVGEGNDFAFDHAATVFLVDRDGSVVDTIGTTDPQDVLTGKLRRLSRS